VPQQQQTLPPVFSEKEPDEVPGQKWEYNSYNTISHKLFLLQEQKEMSILKVIASPSPWVIFFLFLNRHYPFTLHSSYIIKSIRITSRPS
jgi:hypothetical protein